MSNELKLKYYNCRILEGFRTNERFISRHSETLNMLSDVQWSKNKYMNKEENISSPTRAILGRYICNILAALFIDISDNKINKMIVECSKKSGIDNYSKLILSIIENTTNISIEYKTVNYTITALDITPAKMRTCIKRGLYDSFSCSNNTLVWIYNYYKSVYYGKFYKLEELIQKYYQINKNEKYEKWLFIKAIINQGIRQNNKKVVEQFMKELKFNNKGEYDYINSYSFYLLRFFSPEKCKLFLEDTLKLDNFLNSQKLDFARSLVFKNYASLLPEDSDIKHKIMKRCLEDTPQDVDLWKEWFKIFGTKDEIVKKSTKIFESGYSDVEILQHVKINSTKVESMVRAIILLNTCSNHILAKELLSNVDNKKLKSILKNFIENYDFTSMIERWEYDPDF